MDEPKKHWQYSYVEKWADGSGVYDRVTFKSFADAKKYYADNRVRIRELNREAEEGDEVIASIEKRVTYDPGEWTPLTF